MRAPFSFEALIAGLAITVFAIMLGLGYASQKRANTIDVLGSGEFAFTTSRAAMDFSHLKDAAFHASLGHPTGDSETLRKRFSAAKTRVIALTSGEASAVDDRRFKAKLEGLVEIMAEVETIMADVGCNTRCRGVRIVAATTDLDRLGALINTFGMEHDSEMRGRLVRSVRDSTNDFVLVTVAFFGFSALLSIYLLMRTRVLQRQTAELTENRDRLRELSNYRADFLAGMSHEFRTPLNAVKGFSQLIMLRNGDVERDVLLEYMDHINKSAADLEVLMDGVLDLSKIDSGKFVLDVETVKVMEVAQDVSAQFEGVAGDRRRIALDIPASLTLQCDRQALKRCLQNLISNALKFSSSETRVDVLVRPTPETVTITVRDRGCGIPREEIEAVWGVYARSSYSRNAAQGTGLGLALTKALVEAHGGSVAIDSELGIGTSVSLTFPLAAKSAAAKPRHAEARLAA